ncbi:MAG: DEAD/DEAH box helicase [Cardiobacteriaceae bacterium]|nr:DEAD/DEAH box helicase [Cardiobacteriaceae bacterium]
MQNFNELPLPQPLLNAIANSGYTTPTPIQAQAIPLALEGRDLLLSAQTGSGKTAAFVLPALTKIIQSANPKSKKPQVLILTPTRELAQQVHEQVRKYGKELKWLFSAPLVGGAPYGGQIRALSKGVQIIIATPGRLLDHMRDERIDFSELHTLILDEADRMLDMGFADDINAIMEAAPKERQTIMSSATWDGPVGKIANRYTNNAEKVTIKVESAHIEERVYFCDNQDHKQKILEHLLSDPEMGQTIIFAATKASTEDLADKLREQGYRARFLHGDLAQVKRNRIVEDVRKGKCDILVATDVAARGIDIPTISHVINYDLPHQVEDYVHRIGRSGRAGRTGIALSLCSLQDRSSLSSIRRYLQRDIEEHQIAGLEPQILAKPKTKPKKKMRGNPRKEWGGGAKRFDKERSPSERFAREQGAERRAHKADKPKRFATSERNERDFSERKPKKERNFERDFSDKKPKRFATFERNERDFSERKPKKERSERDFSDKKPKRFAEFNGNKSHKSRDSIRTFSRT